MALKDYLTQKTADYTAEQLNITPQRTMPVSPVENQSILKADDGSVTPIELHSNNYFDVQVQWDVLSETDANTIFDFFMNSSKANRFMYTFEWPHPTDENTYIVRFITNISKTVKPGNIRSVAQITLRVEGYK